MTALKVWRALRRGFHFGIKIGDDVLEGGDRLLNRGDLHQFPAVDRAVALLQPYHQIAPLFLELDQRQPVIRERFHHDVP